jgi:hypothetical protein
LCADLGGPNTSVPKELGSHPLCQFFLSGYLSVHDDPTNFPLDQEPALFDRYENIFQSALDALKISKEALRHKAEFNFDSGNAANLESAVGVLRAVETLRQLNFQKITIPEPPGADILCEKDGQTVCCEVKTITKQSSPRKGFFFADQVYEKMFENIDKAGDQLHECAKELPASTVTLFISVSNWFDQAIYLTEQDYQYIVNRLAKDQLEGGDLRESLQGIDGVLFLTKFGNRFLFLNERGKSIDR